MSKAQERKRGRMLAYFRCRKCKTRVLNAKHRFIEQAQHLADCLKCHRALVKTGSRRPYLRCVNCKTCIARKGQSKIIKKTAHLASCVECKSRMCINRTRGRAHFFYCVKCKISTNRTFTKPVRFNEQHLLPLIDAWLPKSLYGELRDEVRADILLALLKTRRAKGGYGFNTTKLNSQAVNQFVRKARKRLGYDHKQVSLFAGEYPLIEQLHG